MTVDNTNPTFDEAYAETERGYQAAGIDDADLTYLTREFYEALLADTEQDAARDRAPASDTCDPGNPGDPFERALLHHIVFLGGGRLRGYRASSIGGCQMTALVTTSGVPIFERTCASGGAAIFRIAPV